MKYFLGKKRSKGKKHAKKQSSNNKIQQLASDQNLTPSIEYYKNIAASYKKSLDNLPINKQKSVIKEEEEIVQGFSDIMPSTREM